MVRGSLPRNWPNWWNFDSIHIKLEKLLGNFGVWWFFYDERYYYKEWIISFNSKLYFQPRIYDNG